MEEALGPARTPSGKRRTTPGDHLTVEDNAGGLRRLHAGHLRTRCRECEPHHSAGETLWSIATANGLSPGALAAANGLAPDAHIIEGTQIVIPAATDTAAASPGAPPPLGSYVVREGDTLTNIATRSGVSMAAVAAMNGLDPGGTAADRHRTEAARPARCSSRARRASPSGRPGRGALRDGGAGQRRDDRRDRGPARRAGFARRRDRVAGERLRQLGGLRPRTRAASCRSFRAPGRGSTGTSRSGRSTRLRRGQRPRGSALPRPAPPGHRGGPGAGRGGVLPGAWLRARAQVCCPRPSATWTTCWRCAPASAAREAGRRRSRLDQPAPDRVAGQLHSVAHPELLEDVAAMVLDRLLADDESVGDLVARMPLGHELDDLQLARGERVGRRPSPRLARSR